MLGWQIESEWLNVSLLVQTHVVLDKEPFLLRDAVLAQNLLFSCVHPSLCPSITNHCSTETDKHWVMQGTLCGSPGI